MNTLESLVPPLELCKQIPEGCFEDSVFVWWTDCCGTIVIKRIDTPYEYGIVAPAPTLAEIMEELPTEKDGYFLVLFDCRNMKKAFQIGYAHLVDGNCVTHPYFKEKDDNPSIAALKLWLELNKEGNGK